MFAKLLLLFILGSLVELYLFITIGTNLGFGLTISIIFVTTILGAAIIKSQGRQALSRLQQAVGRGQIRQPEATKGLLVLVAGFLLFMPGFLSDAVGLALLLPPVRTLTRHFFARSFKEKIRVMPDINSPQADSPFSNSQGPSQSKLDDGKVIDV